MATNEKSAFRQMLRSLSSAALATRPACARHLVLAHRRAVEAGKRADRVGWDLEFRLTKLVRKHAPKVSEIRKEALSIARKHGLVLLLPGIDDTDRYPVPAQLVRIVKRLYPPGEFPKVLDVAGGAGFYARALARVGYQVTIIDPHARRAKTSSRNKPRILRRKLKVADVDSFDLVFAYRPCGASQTVVRAARRRPVVLVPCTCSRVWPGNGGFMAGAERFLKKLGVPYRRKGTVIFTGARALRRGAIQQALENERPSGSNCDDGMKLRASRGARRGVRGDNGKD